MTRPLVSVVVPMLNELGHIEACVAAFGRQTYPLDRIEIIVVDGGSTDGSREVIDKLAIERRWLRVVDNPKRKAAAAFNCGAEAALGEVVCLFSAHGVAADDYVERSVAVLESSGAVGVGGKYLHIGDDRPSRAIGLAMVSPFGMASPHRYASERAEVDTISHPAYLRAALLAAGPFDEGLERNSDYEMNWRLRQAGGTLVFDPSIVSVYRPRPSLRALRRQFWMYGLWKVRVVAAHPGSLRPRHLVAPLAVVGVVLAPLLGSRPIGRRSLALVASAYGVGVLTAARQAKPARHDADPVVLAAAFPTMHGAWGAGFVWGVLRGGLRR